MNISNLSIFIPLGGGPVVGITKEKHLVFVDNEDNLVDLGLATETLFWRVLEYVKRLEIHAVKEDENE